VAVGAGRRRPRPRPARQPADAPALFESALAHHARGHPYDRARPHLTYGEFLRRSQRRVDAGIAQRGRDFLAGGVIAVCPIVELAFLFSARSLADRLHKQQLLREIFTGVPMSDRVDRSQPSLRLLASTQDPYGRR
jgi:hypothetical protein